MANGLCATGKEPQPALQPQPANSSSGSSPTSPTAKPRPGSAPETELSSSNGLSGDEAPSPLQPPSSASSGFSDDDSLHGDLGIQAVSMEQLIETIHARGRAGLVAEYIEIKQRPPEGTFNNAKYVPPFCYTLLLSEPYILLIYFFSSFFRLKPNAAKNRYTDVLCFDHSRICLSQVDNDATSDYINANFVDGYKQKNAFISTQGPLPKTCADFWRMVWEQQTMVIVMTTR